jgi:hypothetical protein
VNEQPPAPQDGTEAAAPDAPTLIEAPSPTASGPPTVASPVVAPSPATLSAPARPETFPAPASAAAGTGSDRPEVAVGAAFVGGFVLALILRRLAR